MSRFVIGQTGDFLPEQFTLGVKILIETTGYRKLATIKLLRQLQYNQDYFNSTEQEKCTMPHPLCLKDAKDIVEEIAEHYHLTLV